MMNHLMPAISQFQLVNQEGLQFINHKPILFPSKWILVRGSLLCSINWSVLFFYLIIFDIIDWHLVIEIFSSIFCGQWKVGICSDVFHQNGFIWQGTVWLQSHILSDASPYSCFLPSTYSSVCFLSFNKLVSMWVVNIVH